mgnify:CR=1 FL=1
MYIAMVLDDQVFSINLNSQAKSNSPSFRRMPESSHFNIFRMSDQARHDESGAFYEYIKVWAPIRLPAWPYPVRSKGSHLSLVPTQSVGTRGKMGSAILIVPKSRWAKLEPSPKTLSFQRHSALSLKLLSTYPRSHE